MKQEVRTFMGDFETTVYTGQVCTEVWASASVELYTEDVLILHSIEDQFEYFSNLKTNVVCYYHNLKFDGMFWLDFLMHKTELKQATYKDSNGSVKFYKDKEMPTNSYKYSINDMGQWYSLTIQLYKRKIIFKDSLKLLPFSVEKIGKSFGTKHKKLNMEYCGFRYAGCDITDEEKRYIANDVLVVKEALEIMFKQGHNKLTIGSCCLAEYKKLIRYDTYREYFPDISDMPIDKALYEYSTADEYIRRSYRGGWCYLVKGKENKIKEHGVTADVNSLYPSMMSSESDNYYPIGLPTFWKGNYIPQEALSPFRYFFIRVKTRFKIKDGYLPFIQQKYSMLYMSNECLETSDVYDAKTGKYSRYYMEDGKLRDSIMTMTLTMTDYYLLKEHYDLYDFEIIDGCYFESKKGIFDKYINKYKKIKITSKGALRELAKLFLNNLYGKMAASTDSSYKVAYLKPDGTLAFTEMLENDKKAGYIPVGSAITSYARNFTIRAAQKNYHGVNKRGFIYADTDSIHCDLNPNEVVGIKVHPTDFCCWKLESTWDIGYFVRQKTYIEHVIEEDLEPIDEPYYNVKCAGMPEKCKQLFLKSMKGFTPKTKKASGIYKKKKGNKPYKPIEIKFIARKRKLTDFKIGLVVPSKLIPKKITGGVLLVDTTFQMR